MPTLTINGHAHHYEEVGKGETVLFLNHLVTDNAKNLMASLASDTTVHLISPDGRGMGESAHTTDVAASDWVDDVVGLLDALSLPSVHVMGATLGSRLALRFAADHPERVKSLILDASIAVSEPEGDAWRRRFLHPDTILPQFKAAMPSLHGDDWEEVVSLYLRIHDDNGFKSYLDAYDFVGRVTAPTLLMHGDTDSSPVYPLDHSERLHALLPDSWLAVYPNTGGEIRVKHPHEYWRLASVFLKEKG